MRSASATTRLVVALALTAACASACGRKTPVRPPDLVAPRVVTDVVATNTADGIEVSWGRPTRYVDGSHMLDLAAFRIERGRPCCGLRNLATVEIEDRHRFRRAKTFRYLDTAVEPGQSYSYRIYALTVDEYSSQPSELVRIQRALVTPQP